MSNAPLVRAAAAQITLLPAVAALVGTVHVATAADEPSPAVLTLAALALATALVLHFVVVAVQARRAGRRGGRRVLGAQPTFPLGSAVGLILHEWHVRVDDVAADAAPRASPQR